jgi:hypothetical protein
MDELLESGEHTRPERAEARPHMPLPAVTNAERAFWRRAVEIERARQRRGRPAPFPFQPA